MHQSSPKSFPFPKALPLQSVEIRFERYFLLEENVYLLAQKLCGLYASSTPQRALKPSFEVVPLAPLLPKAVMLCQKDFECLQREYPLPQQFLDFEMKEKGVVATAVIPKSELIKFEYEKKPKLTAVTLLPGSLVGEVTPSLGQKHDEIRNQHAHLLKEYPYDPTLRILDGLITFPDLSSAARFLAGSPQAGWQYFRRTN